MKHSFIIFALSSLIAGSTWGQTLEFPPDRPGDSPEINEILNDTEFLKFYEQLHGQRLPRNTLLSSQLSPQVIADIPNAALTTVSPQRTPQMLLDIAVQQLTQLDNQKNLLLHDLRHAETCGYRAVRIAADGEVQANFQAGPYVPSPSCFHWAIHGDGFFVLRKQGEPSDADESMDPGLNDTFYTRAGRFELTEERKLCLKHDGETYLLQPEIEVPVDADVNEAEWQFARFDRPEQMRRIDGIMFQAEPDGEMPKWFHPTALSGTTIHVHEYETSNVDVAETMQIYRALHKMQSAILDIVVF